MNAWRHKEKAPKSKIVVALSRKKSLTEVSPRELKLWAKATLRKMGVSRAELSLALVDDSRIRELNRRYRNQDKPTDVLSFPLQDPLWPDLLGDVVISVDTARRQAERRKVSVAEEIQTLLVHGILHLLGYDHEVSRAEAVRMQRKERELKSFLNGG